MNDQQWNAIDNIPVLSDVVIPGVLCDTTNQNRRQPHRARPSTHRTPENPGRILLAEMQDRIEHMVEEELARAHSSALNTRASHCNSACGWKWKSASMRSSKLQWCRAMPDSSHAEQCRTVTA